MFTEGFKKTAKEKEDSPVLKYTGAGFLTGGLAGAGAGAGLVHNTNKHPRMKKGLSEYAKEMNKRRPYGAALTGKRIGKKMTGKKLGRILTASGIVSGAGAGAVAGGVAGQIAGLGAKAYRKVKHSLSDKKE